MCGQSPPPPTATILISATIQDPYPPTLSDGFHTSNTEAGDIAFTTGVKVGTVVTFRKSGNISAITAITYTGDSNLFSQAPAQQNDGTWQGVIGNLAVGLIETYSISYNVGGNPYTQDPKIEINQ